jgi:hypothetical protein
MLLASGLPQQFWAFAVQHATDIYNHLPHTHLEGRSPVEALTGCPPDLRGLHVFGSPAYVTVSEQRRKLDDKSRPAVYIGRSRYNLTCLLTVMLDTLTVRESRHVTLDERPSRAPRKLAGQPASEDFWPRYGLEEEEEEETSQATQVNMAATRANSDPKSYAAALRSPQASEWMAAYATEIDGLKRQQVFEAVPISDLPQGTTILRAVIRFTSKYDSDGTLKKRKARVCVDGSRQSTDFAHYAPVASLRTVRTFLTVAAARGWGVHSADVVGAFLYANLTEEEKVFMWPPEGQPRRTPSGEKLVWRLRKSL